MSLVIVEGTDESGEARLYTSLCVTFVNVNTYGRMWSLQLCLLS